MSIDLGLVPLTPQTGHYARAASQALLKELLGKGLARRGISGCVASAGQALVGRKGPTPFMGLTCLRALPETPRRCHHFGNLFSAFALDRIAAAADKRIEVGHHAGESTDARMSQFATERFAGQEPERPKQKARAYHHLILHLTERRHESPIGKS
jgi:hypothetical protein